MKPTADDYRDRALLLLGFAGALRRSELVALDVADLDFCPEGLRLTIRQSKTDQECAGQVIAIAPGTRLETCPLEALRRWLRFAGISTGAVFRRLDGRGNVSIDRLDAASVAHILKRRAEAAGLDGERFSAHSLRSGFLTSAAMAGASIWKMIEVSRHRRLETVKGYVRGAQLFEKHAGRGLL